MSTRRPRSRPEWVTFAVSSGLLAVMVALIVGQAWGPLEPAQPKADRVGQTRPLGDRFVVEVTVSNTGDEAAQNVQVVGEIVVADEVVETGDQSVDFLAGGETVTLNFVFDQDPGEPTTANDTTLRIYVTGFTEP